MRLSRILVLLIILFSTSVTQAQFWKNVSKKAKQAAERTVERKVEEKSERETDKAFDSVFNNQGTISKGKKALPADLYSFSYKYTLEVKDSKNATDIQYYLTNEAPYFASSSALEGDQEMITVLDIPNKTAHTFMDMGGQKTMMSIPLDMDGMVEDEMEDAQLQITPSGNSKVILGYSCEEYAVQGPESEGTIWVTKEAPFSLSTAFSQMKSSEIKSMKGMNQAWMNLIEGLVMEMQMTDTSRRKPATISMTCKSIEEMNLTIDTSLYSKTF